MSYAADAYSTFPTATTRPEYSDYTTSKPADIANADLPPNAPLHGAMPVNVADTERVLSGVAGAILATYAVSKRHDLTGVALALAGGYLIFRGASGYCPGYAALHTGSTHASTDSPTAVIPHGQGIKVQQSVFINADADMLYDFWRDFENLPRFMAHLEDVTVQDSTRSHWVAKAPFGKTVEWDAEIINEIPGELIAWRSTGNADIPNTGSVRFKTAAAGREPKFTSTWNSLPPAGVLGMAVAKIWGEEPNQQVLDDLRHFKQLIEAGEIPTTIGQPQGNAAGMTVPSVFPPAK